MMAPDDGAKKQPYFGAILTDAGREFVGMATRNQTEIGDGTKRL